MTEASRLRVRGHIVVPCRVVARVKLPATAIFDVIRELNRDMTDYEREYGEITKPGRQEPET